MKLLIVEDEQKVQNFLKKGLNSQETSVDTASTPQELLSLLAANNYDIIILDRLLGGIDALKYIPEIRQKSPAVKIIVLSALSEVDDKVDGLNHGADDYLAKPFHLSELQARIQAVTRRETLAGTLDNLVQLKDLTIHLDTQKVERNGVRIPLTAKEYKLMVFLARNPNHIFSKIDILSEIWEIKYFPESNIVEVLVNHLRGKIDKDFDPPLIHSKRSVGYWAGDKEA